MVYLNADEVYTSMEEMTMNVDGFFLMDSNGYKKAL